ncbi:DUF3099 domain-containing protein [Microbacterium sp. P05]|uniref:DUF3099 domain-containing protein n=1 Tax=Microbacterium sp. P05 TaxID=3366948 RepID=UPI003746EF5C
MKTTPPSATSLPRAPRDEAEARFAKYAITMGVRIVCFIAMVAITPYGWYTWVLGAAAIFLPWIAVVVANVGEEIQTPVAENPERMLEAPAPVASTAPAAGPTVIRISETPAVIAPPKDAA